MERPDGCHRYHFAAVDERVDFQGIITSCPPVLLIGFNRPEFFHRQIENLRSVRPQRLFVNVDGPRKGNPQDSTLRSEVIACLDEIDWPCTIEMRLLEDNQGLNAGVTGAISWLFEHVDRGVIIEDDCIARPEFFGFAGELLDRYASESKVKHISGVSMVSSPDAATSYVFTSVGHIWGWATWRRAWTEMDPSMVAWPQSRDAVRRSGPVGRALARKFDSCATGRKVRWARWWYLANVVHEGVAIVPSVNLVENIGIGPSATNTTGGRHPLVRTCELPLEFPLKHPDRIEIDPAYERLSARYHARSLRDRTGDRIAAMKRKLCTFRYQR